MCQQMLKDNNAATQVCSLTELESPVKLEIACFKFQLWTNFKLNENKMFCFIRFSRELVQQVRGEMDTHTHTSQYFIT